MTRQPGGDSERAGSMGGSRTAITVAIIGVLGAVLAALITGYMQRPQAQPKEHRTAARPAAVVAEAPSAVQLIAAHVGKAGPLGPVHAKTTRFAPTDTIAITLRINAAQSVANFPVRVDAKVFGGINMYQARVSADVSQPGPKQITLRFPPSEHYANPLFLSVEIEGMTVYNQELSIEEYDAH